MRSLGTTCGRNRGSVLRSRPRGRCSACVVGAPLACPRRSRGVGLCGDGGELHWAGTSVHPALLIVVYPYGRSGVCLVVTARFASVLARASFLCMTARARVSLSGVEKGSVYARRHHCLPLCLAHASPCPHRRRRPRPRVDPGRWARARRRRRWSPQLLPAAGVQERWAGHCGRLRWIGGGGGVVQSGVVCGGAWAGSSQDSGPASAGESAGSRSRPRRHGPSVRKVRLCALQDKSRTGLTVECK